MLSTSSTHKNVMSFRIRKNNLTLSLCYLIFPTESKDYLKNFTPILSSGAPHHRNVLRKEGHQSLSDAHAQWVLSSHLLVFLVTLYAADHSLLLETPSPLKSLTVLPNLSSCCSICSLSILWRPAPLNCLFKAGVFSELCTG